MSNCRFCSQNNSKFILSHYDNNNFVEIYVEYT